MYYDYFGLTQPPFRITPNTDFFFAGGNRGAILDALLYAVTHGEGIVKVTGEVGSGKTMLCSMLQSRLPADVETVYLANPSVAPEEVLHAIAVDLHLPVDRAADRLTVMHELQEYLLTRYAQHKRVVLFIEESQSMPVATLEEIRLLSNLETKNEKLMQIVMFGQPEFDETLRQPNIRQLRDRIAHSFRLEPLDADATREYLAFRMRAAGYKGPDVFSRRIVRQIARASSGLTRRINLIADKALLAAFADNTHTIRMRHIKAALRDSEFGSALPAPIWSRFGWPAAALTVGLAAGASVSIYAFGGRSDASAHSPSLAGSVLSAVAAAAAAPTGTPVTLAAAAGAAGTQPQVPLQKEAAPAAKEMVPMVLAGPAPAAGAVAAGVEEDWLASRSSATQLWLEQQGDSVYSIQIFGAGDEHLLKQHLNVLSKSIEMQKVFVYRVEARGKPWMNVLYGAFPDRMEAQRALEALPPALKAYKPMLRTVQGVRIDLTRNRGS